MPHPHFIHLVHSTDLDLRLFIDKTPDELLAALGDTCDEVIETLKALQIKGGRDCFTCPIAVFLEVFTGSAWYVSEDGWCAPGGVSESRSTNLPNPVREFINRFDRGELLEMAVNP